jgi:hypothetical protein
VSEVRIRHLATRQWLSTSTSTSTSTALARSPEGMLAVGTRC